MGQPEQPGNGDKRRHGEAGIPYHGQGGAGQGGRGFHQNRNQRHHDRRLQKAAGDGGPGELHRGDFRQPDPENQQRPQGTGHPAEAAQGYLQPG